MTSTSISVLPTHRHPVTISMWDFSWLERRWPGAGYEDWNVALDGLKERGYDAVRIDAYPHLVAADPQAKWELLPCWYFLDWGAPCRTVVQVQPGLTDFIALCRDKKIKVGLSTWFRQDRADTRMLITNPACHAHIWIKTLNLIREAGLLDAIYYVDLCNEWPLNVWAPFFKYHSDQPNKGATPESRQWMAEVCAAVRAEFPELPLTFSFWPDTESSLNFSFMDFFEPHIWMAQHRKFYDRVGYTYQKYDIAGMEAVSLRAEQVYRTDPAYWQAGLTGKIDAYAAYSRRTNRLLMTTECWGAVDYKDWPLLDWGWIKELCEIGALHAAGSGRWFSLATSNFCGPQFRGMWRDVAWHQALTKKIKNCRVDEPAAEQ